MEPAQASRNVMKESTPVFLFWKLLAICGMRAMQFMKMQLPATIGQADSGTMVSLRSQKP